MKVTNEPTQIDTWCTIFSFLKKTNPREYQIIFRDLQSCTDYLTDWLMYPDNCPIEKINKDILFDTNSTNLYVGCTSDTSKQNFIKYGLPVIHKIEKANGFKLTKVYNPNHKKGLIVLGSKLWMHSTFTLSLYLKLIRNFILLKEAVVEPKQLKILEPRDKYSFNHDLLWKICFSGNLRAVNRGCKYKHGWKKSDQGNHSNNGIHFTLETLRWKPVSKTAWNFKMISHQFNNFKRRNNMLKLQKQLKDFDYAL